MPTLEKAFEHFMAASPDRLYRGEFARYFADWHQRPLDEISRRDVEALLNRLTGDSGWSPANWAVSLLRSLYRRPCVDFEGLRNPVDLWLAGGGRYHRSRRRKIPSERGLRQDRNHRCRHTRRSLPISTRPGRTTTPVCKTRARISAVAARSSRPAVAFSTA